MVGTFLPGRGRGTGKPARGRPGHACPSWTYLGSIGDVRTSLYDFLWIVHVTHDRETAYLMNMRGLIFELNSASGASTLIADLSTLDPLFASEKYQFGAAAWSRGRFFSPRSTSTLRRSSTCRPSIPSA